MAILNIKDDSGNIKKFFSLSFIGRFYLSAERISR